MRYPAAIRESTDLQDVPVMALTADNRRETVQFVLSAGANDYTLKAIFHDNNKPTRKPLNSKPSFTPTTSQQGQQESH